MSFTPPTVCNIHCNSQGNPDFVRYHTFTGKGNKEQTYYFAKLPFNKRPNDFLCLHAGRSFQREYDQARFVERRDLPTEVKRIFDLGEYMYQMFPKFPEVPKVVICGSRKKPSIVWKLFEGKPLRPGGKPLDYLYLLQKAAGCELFADSD